MPTQSTDVSGNPAIAYTATGQSWTILKNVDVDTLTYAVHSTYANSSLVNKGSISGGEAGVYFQGGGFASNYKVANAKSGEISSQYGIAMTDFIGSATIESKGSIDATQYAIYILGKSDVRVVNKGEIDSDAYGILASATSLTVENYGTIKSAGYAVALAGSADSKDMVVTNGGTIDGVYGIIAQTPGAAKITNLKGGVIEGDEVSIYTIGKATIKNEGKIEGLIVTSLEDDKIINKKKIDGGIILDDGNDVFKNKDKGSVDGIISGGKGNDTFVLGTKAEQLLFDSTLDAATNVDTIRNFTSGKDMFLLSQGIFTALSPGELPATAFVKGKAAVDADDRIIYDKKTGSLYYDADGSGAGAQVQFASLDKNTKLKASDFDVGSFVVL
ncbi:MAG: calcium-binding protein [Rhizobiales bacterium]|nr:calcium-binding protein [Hyphomicrobiales bacterium]